MKLEAEIDRLGKQIEEGDADDRAGAETQDEVQFVAQPQREQSPGHGAHERCEGDAYE